MPFLNMYTNNGEEVQFYNLHAWQVCWYVYRNLHIVCTYLKTISKMHFSICVCTYLRFHLFSYLVLLQAQAAATNCTYWQLKQLYVDMCVRVKSRTFLNFLFTSKEKSYIPDQHDIKREVILPTAKDFTKCIFNLWRIYFS